MRICSLIPSATEIVCLLGLRDHLVGRSHECDYPAGVEEVPVVMRSRIESTLSRSSAIDRQVAEYLAKGESIYTIDIEALRAADPHLILTQALCDVCAVSLSEVEMAITHLPRPPRVLSLDPTLVGDVLRNIRAVAEATGRVKAGGAVATALERRIAAVCERAARASVRPRLFCLEWVEPLYASGHWVPEMAEMAGGVDVLGRKGMPSFAVSWEAVRQAAPEVLVVMPCGFTAERAREEIPALIRLPGWTELPAVRAGRVYAANGSAYFSRSGPRLVDGLEILAGILHPDLFPEFVGKGGTVQIAEGGATA